MNGLHLHIIDRATAKAHGLKRYFTGRPCLYRQTAERKTNNGQCTCFLCAALQQFKTKEWAQANKTRRNDQQNKRRKSARTAGHNLTITGR